MTLKDVVEVLDDCWLNIEAIDEDGDAYSVLMTSLMSVIKHTKDSI